VAIGFSPEGDLIISGTYDNKDNLVARPTNVEMLTQGICNMLQRNMFPEEWNTYVGPGVPYEKTCSDLDVNIKVNVIR
jgi:hypothetical protein